MGRLNTESWKSIHSMCMVYGLDENLIYDKAKLLLNMYRRVCWNVLDRASDVKEDILCYTAYSTDLDGALIYLEQFAPDRDREQFEMRVASLFTTRWMLKLVDEAMIEVKEFPDQGKLYYEILSKCFLSKERYTENDMLELLEVERSRFYDRKREAIMVFGIALWGGVIPKNIELMSASM